MEYEIILGDHIHMKSYFLRHLLNIPNSNGFFSSKRRDY